MLVRDFVTPSAARTPAAAADAQRHLDGLTKPPGSLGRLEELAVRLAALTGRRRRASPRR